MSVTPYSVYVTFVICITCLCDNMCEYLKHKLCLFPGCNPMSYWWAKSHAVCADQAYLLTGSTSDPTVDVYRNDTVTINNTKDDILSTCAWFLHNIRIKPVNWMLRCALLIHISSAVCLASVFSAIMNLFGSTLHELQIYIILF